MALHVDWRNVENWEALDPDEQQRVAFLLMIIGIDEITEKNCREVYYRALMYYMLTCEGPAEEGFALADVRAYIGVTTNVNPLTPAKWDRQLGKIARNRAESALRRMEVTQQA